MGFCPFPRGRIFGIAVPSTYRENAPLCAMTIHEPLRRAPIVENAINALECEDGDGFCQVEIPSTLAPSKTRVRRVDNDASCPKTQTNSRPLRRDASNERCLGWTERMVWIWRRNSARQRLSQSQCRVGWSPRIPRTPPGFELSDPFVFSDTTGTCGAGLASWAAH